MKNPWKTRHRFFRVDRVYIHQNDRFDLTVSKFFWNSKEKIIFRFDRVYIQNDRLDLMVNEFFAVWKTILLGQRYSQKCTMKKLKELEISLAKKHRFPNRKKLVNREIETVVLMYINPFNSKKSVMSFSWIFHFWLIDFSRKSLK